MFLERNPVSFRFGAGYFAYAPRLSETHHGLAADAVLNGLKAEGSVQFHF